MLAHWMPYRSFDAKKELFYNTDSIAWAIEVTPLLGADDQAGDILTQFLSEGIPAGCGSWHACSRHRSRRPSWSPA